MKIALNFRQADSLGPEEDLDKTIERDVLACKTGDWEAKARMLRTFMPLLTALAKKRATEISEINRYIEAGKAGLMIAVRRYKPASGAKFQIFASSLIETEMVRLNQPGFFARLFGAKG